MSIALNNINKSFGKDTILENFSIEFEENVFTSICGVSGCGKTTLLRILAGLEKIQSGTISGTENKKMGFLFQENRLLPFKTVYKNIALVSSLTEIEINDILKQVGLYDSRNLYPEELSGGMKQRTAIARLLAYDCNVWLLDEPFKELDNKTKTSLWDLIKEKQNGRTVIMVTHDADEAESLADTIITLDERPLKIIKTVYTDKRTS